MTDRTRTTLTGGLLAALLLVTTTLVSPAATAQAPPAGEPGTESANVVIHFRMGTIDGKKREVTKSYTLVVASGSMGSSLLAGERVPFPTAPDGSDADDMADAYVYQNIGFATDAKAWIIGDGKIKLMADIEDSRIRESDEDGFPVVETRQVTINAILRDGVPLELTRAEGVTDLSGFVEVEAQILK